MQQKGDVISLKTLIALGADVNQRNEYNMTAVDVASYLQHSDLNMLQIIKDVGGMSAKEVLPQQESAGVQQMDISEATPSKGGVFSLSLLTIMFTHSTTTTNLFQLAPLCCVWTTVAPWLLSS